MVELITDRTQAHVSRLATLREKGWENLSEAEKAEWYGEAAKGAYNYTDLNRVETAVSEISDMLNLGLTTKTDWTMWDVPTQYDMTRYIENIREIREICLIKENTTDVPSRMSGLTYEAANNIEKVLLVAYRVANAIVRSGEIYSGEV